MSARYWAAPQRTTGHPMRGLFTSAHNSIVNFGLTKREAFRSHFGNQMGGSMSGIYVRLPFTRLSAFMEWREQSVGFGYDSAARHLEVYAGRFQGAFCLEPKAAW